MTPLDYARAAQRAYVTPPTIGSEDTAARAIVEGGMVAFPGTNNIACWLADLDADIQHVPGMGAVHCGFWDTLKAMKRPLMAIPDVEVAVGHSLGGALAILYAAARCLAGVPVKEVWAFEPPHVSADGVLAKLFSDNGVKLHIYRNGEDIVPCIPRILHDWRHPAALIPIGKPLLPIWNVHDHKMDRVIEALSES